MLSALLVDGVSTSAAVMHSVSLLSFSLALCCFLKSSLLLSDVNGSSWCVGDVSLLTKCLVVVYESALLSDKRKED